VSRSRSVVQFPRIGYKYVVVNYRRHKYRDSHMSSRSELVRATSEPQCAVLQSSQRSRCNIVYNQRYEHARGTFRGRGSSYHSIVSGPPASREWPATRSLWTTSMTTSNSEIWNDKRHLAKQPLHAHGTLINALCSRTWA